MATTKEDQKKKEKKLRDELQGLLNSSIVTDDGQSATQDTGLTDASVFEPMTEERAASEAYTGPTLNIAETDAAFKKQAKGVIEAMYDLYYGIGAMDKPEYVERKKNINAMSMSSMLFSLKTTKFVISKVLDEINRGNMNPKLIENFCTLNNQMSELTKNQANYMIFLEESVKKLRIETLEYNKNKKLAEHKESLAISSPIEDVEEIKEIENEKEKIMKDGKFFITSDPKVLLNEVSSSKLTYEEVASERPDYLKERGDVSNLVDYSNKNDLMNNYDVDTTTLKEESESGDDSDLLEMI